MLTLFARSLILYAAAVLALRAMGKRQIGQLQPYEMVVVLMIADLAASPMAGVGVPLLYGLVPIAALTACHGLIAALSMRSIRFRGWMSGRPTVLMRNGVICEKQLRRMSFTLDDLMEALRTGGILDPAEAGTAVMETNGHISVFPRAAFRSVTPEDLGLAPDREGLPLPLIMDGRVHTRNLQRGGLTQAWLDEQVRALGFERADEILLLCLNTSGLLWAQGKGQENMRQLRALEPELVRW